VKKNNKKFKKSEKKTAKQKWKKKTKKWKKNKKVTKKKEEVIHGKFYCNPQYNKCEWTVNFSYPLIFVLMF
jgi:hypothetical protein